MKSKKPKLKLWTPKQGVTLERHVLDSNARALEPENPKLKLWVVYGHRL